MSFVRACARSELTPGTPLAADVDGTAVVLAAVGEDVYALRDECSHAKIALSEGDVEGCAIECYLHGSLFDLKTGKPLNLPATEPVATYPVRIDGDEVFVDVESPLTEEK